MISGTAWANDLYARLVGIGFQGSYLERFTNTIGMASAEAVIGRAFTTLDIGAVPGNGVGTGTGITGLNEATMSSNMYSLSVASFGQEGAKLKDTCDQIAASCIAQLGNATLATIDSPVYAGTGTIVTGSITVDPSSWSSLISAQGDSSGFLGAQWPSWAQAIGTGQAMEVIADGTGSVTIVGSPYDPPGPGTGSGTGTIS